jgi:hypothetical protein
LIDKASKETNTEGYVLRDVTGYMVKYKTPEFLLLKEIQTAMEHCAGMNEPLATGTRYSIVNLIRAINMPMPARNKRDGVSIRRWLERSRGKDWYSIIAPKTLGEKLD